MKSQLSQAVRSGIIHKVFTITTVWKVSLVPTVTVYFGWLPPPQYNGQLPMTCSAAALLSASDDESSDHGGGGGGGGRDKWSQVALASRAQNPI